jgi:4-oxalocrotonate tautomerase
MGIGVHGSNRIALARSSARSLQQEARRQSPLLWSPRDSEKLTSASPAATRREPRRNESEPEMPIINIKFIKDVVATDEQKAELIVKMTDTFVGVLGDVVRPFTYVVIDETPVGQWGIAGVPMPDLGYLIGDEHAAVIAKSNQMMKDAIEQMAQEAAQADKPAA